MQKVSEYIPKLFKQNLPMVHTESLIIKAHLKQVTVHDLQCYTSITLHGCPLHRDVSGQVEVFLQ